MKIANGIQRFLLQLHVQYLLSAYCPLWLTLRALPAQMSALLARDTVLGGQAEPIRPDPLYSTLYLALRRGT